MSDSKSNPTIWPAIGVLLAFGITTFMDLEGLSMYSALPLLPLGLLLWWRQGFDRKEMGLVRGRFWHYGLALLYPLLVVGISALVVLLAGVAEVVEIDSVKLGRNLLLLVVTGIPMLVLTEEGFFRGWLWASLGRAGLDGRTTLVASSIAFALWHLTWAVLETGLGLPALQVPVYLLNAAIMGCGWGLLRWISGSIVVASLSHAVWNALAYSLFGAGPIMGVLGIENTLLFDVETGLLGLLLNLVVTLGLWMGWRGHRRAAG